MVYIGEQNTYPKEIVEEEKHIEPVEDPYKDIRAAIDYMVVREQAQETTEPEVPEIINMSVEIHKEEDTIEDYYIPDRVKLTDEQRQEMCSNLLNLLEDRETGSRGNEVSYDKPVGRPTKTGKSPIKRRIPTR
jgi:hypothetical protein